MAKVDIRCSRVKSGLHAQWFLLRDRMFQLFPEIVLHNDLDCAAFYYIKLFFR